MPGFPAGETVTIVRPGPVTGRDAYGNDVRGADEEIQSKGWAVAPAGSTEDTQARDQSTSVLTAWPPGGTDVRYTDRILRRGVLYEIRGEPGEWQSPFTGTTSPMQVSLVRVTG